MAYKPGQFSQGLMAPTVPQSSGYRPGMYSSQGNQDNSFVKGAIEGTPFSQSGAMMAQGQNPYPGTPEGLGRESGDLGALYGIGAGMMGAGAAPVAAGIAGAAGLNGLMEKLGWNNYFKGQAANIRAHAPQPQSQSVASNFLQMLPNELQAQSQELIPSALQMLSLGIGGKAAGAMAPKMAPAEVPAAAQALEANGGQPTAAMRATSPIGKSVLGAVEQSARVNPLLGGKYSTIDAANAEAAGQIAQNQFGADINQPGVKATAGKAMQGVLGNMAQERSAAYQPSMDKFENVKNISGFGRRIAKALDASQNSGEMLPSVSKLFDPLKAKLAKGNMTPQQVELEIQDMRNNFDSQFASLKQANAGGFSGADRSFKLGVDAIKGAYYDSLNKMKPGLGDTLREAKGDYAQASEAMSPLSKAIGMKTNAPEAITNDLLNSGSESLKALKENMSSADWEVTRKQLARTILDMAKGKNGGISPDKLQSLLNSNSKIREITPIVFGEGDELGNMKGLVDIGKTAKQNELGTVNPPGTAVLAARLAQGAALASPHLWPGLAGKMGVDAAYTYAGNPLLNAARGIQGTASAGLQAAGNAGPIASVSPLLTVNNKRKK